MFSDVAAMEAENVPGPHCMQDWIARSGPYFPTVHHWHMVAPRELEYVPKGHASHMLSAEAPRAVENFPAPHATQDSLDVDAEPVENVPAEHISHVSPVTAPIVFENFPATQTSHMVLELLDPYFPASHR